MRLRQDRRSLGEGGRPGVLIHARLKPARDIQKAPLEKDSVGGRREAERRGMSRAALRSAEAGARAEG